VATGQQYGSIGCDGGVRSRSRYGVILRRSTPPQRRTASSIEISAQLEHWLGVKLLVRTTRGLTATEAGLNYYDRARRMIEEVDEAELAARGAGSGLTGRLRICGAVTFARIHLMPVIRNLKWKSFWTIGTSTSFKRGSMSPSAWGSSLTPA
jgi:hypothetical protein